MDSEKYVGANFVSTVVTTVALGVAAVQCNEINTLCRRTVALESAQKEE